MNKSYSINTNLVRRLDRDLDLARELLPEPVNPVPKTK